MIEILMPLLVALCQIESNHNPSAIGDNGQAVGILQIHPEVVIDVNRIYKTNFVLADRTDPSKSQAMAKMYLLHYGSTKRLGRPATAQDLARIWNMGPRGFTKTNSNVYWNKVKKVLDENATSKTYRSRVESYPR